METNDYYGDKFYQRQMDGSHRSAYIVLTELFKHYHPKSIVDFGCGRGTWLSAARRLGIKRTVGLDGSWVKFSDLVDKEIELRNVDFEGGVRLDEKFDLAISVEVAEHISESSARNFVESLCAASDVVLFGAAVVNQGGVNHVNEQWQSYWAKLFEDNGYRYFDIIRPVLWNDKSVEWFYRQNTLLYTRNDVLSSELENVKLVLPTIVDVVHPENLQYQIEKMRNAIDHAGSSLVKTVIKNYLKRKFSSKT